MIRLFKVCIFTIAGCLACRASDDTLSRGVPGTYQRSDGMHDEALTLKPDGSYVFVTQFDIGTDRERGVWTVREGVVVLAVKKKGEIFRKKPARLLILAIDGDLVLRAQDDGIGPEDEQALRALLRREKNGANQAPQRNAGSRPSSDDSPVSETPSSSARVADLWSIGGREDDCY